jgi:hypothetical protein
MALRYHAIKSVLIQGKIKEKLVYKLYPSNEFSEGVWNLCLVSISYSTDTNDNVKDIFSISCNVVKNQRFSESNEIEIYDQPLNSFLLDTSLKKNTIYFGTQWFHINAISNEIKFCLKNETSQEILFNAKIFAQVIFQRII